MAMDIAFMAFRSSHNASVAAAHRPLRWFMIGSSPQGGRDYLMTRVFTVKWEDLGDMFGDAELLYSWQLPRNICKWHISRRDADPEDSVDGEMEVLENLRRRVECHILPPCTLGKSRGGTGDRLHAFVHQLALENRSNAQLAE